MTNICVGNPGYGHWKASQGISGLGHQKSIKSFTYPRKYVYVNVIQSFTVQVVKKVQPFFRNKSIFQPLTSN